MFDACWKSTCRLTTGGVRSTRHEPQMTKQLKALQKENSRLKKLVAEQTLDMEILKGMTSLSYLWLNGTR